MYIEDIIIKLVNSRYKTTVGNFLYHDICSSNEFQILTSMCDQISMENALTEKQGILALRILNSYAATFKSVIPQIDNMLSNPQWKYKFRTISSIRSITIEDYSDSIIIKPTRKIILRFPYDTALIEQLRTRNRQVHDLHKGTWDPRTKSWRFALTEKNIMFIGALSEYKFTTDTEFTDYYNALMKMSDNIEKHVPMLCKQRGQFIINNGHGLIPQPNADSVVEAAFFAKRYGVQTWDDEVDAVVELEKNSVTKRILRSNDNSRLCFNSDKVGIDEFSDLVKYSGKILIIVPGGSELSLVREWTKLAMHVGINSEEISVMFRLPSEQSEFNECVKETNINNPVTDATKLVFVSTKITKPLVKSGIRFNTAIDLGYNNYVHYTMGNIVDGISNLIYYSVKAPTERNIWLRPEL